MLDFKARELKVHTFNQLTLVSSLQQQHEEVLMNLSQLVAYKVRQQQALAFNEMLARGVARRISVTLTSKAVPFFLTMKSVFDGAKKAAVGRLVQHCEQAARSQLLLQAMVATIGKSQRAAVHSYYNELFLHFARQKERASKLRVMLEITTGAVTRKLRYHLKAGFNSIEAVISTRMYILTYLQQFIPLFTSLTPLRKAFEAVRAMPPLHKAPLPAFSISASPTQFAGAVIFAPATPQVAAQPIDHIQPS